MAEPRFMIVTPTFNAARYLDQTILSVVSQAGPFGLHYHVQDGNSDDGTREILLRWERLIDEQRLPFKRVRFAFAVEQDGGMYDAINRGFARLDPRPDDVMAWLGSDDILHTGAVATASSIFDAFPEATFIGGRHAHIDEFAIGRDLNFVAAYSRDLMQAGLYDGRARPFMMQEGTFWRASLWQAVGGLDTRFKFAGDWDLWRRFAKITEFHSVDTVLALHRRRPGQLSTAIDRYWAEVDAHLGEDGHQTYTELGRLTNGIRATDYIGPVIYGTAGSWIVQHITAAPAVGNFRALTAKVADRTRYADRLEEMFSDAQAQLTRFNSELADARSQLEKSRSDLVEAYAHLAATNTRLEEAKRLQPTLVGLPGRRLGEFLCTCAKAAHPVAKRLPMLMRFANSLHHSGVAMQLRANVRERAAQKMRCS